MKSVVKTIGVSLILVFTLFSLASCSKNAEKQVEEDLTGTVSALLGLKEAQEAYLCDASAKDIDAVRVLKESEMADKISRKTVFSVENIEISDKKATADITVSSPDVYAIFCKIVQEKSVTAVDDLLDNVSKELDGDYIKIEKTIACELEYRDEHWYLQTNRELFNVLSGNLYNYYIGLGESTVNELMGENADEK